MSTFIFPYEIKRIKEGEIPDPRVSLSLETPYGWQNVKFLVDSGADVTTLPLARYRRLLDFQRESTPPVRIGGIGGSFVKAYSCPLTVRLGARPFRLRSYLIDSPVDPLLGRLDFWNLFSINFDNRKKRTVFQKL